MKHLFLLHPDYELGRKMGLEDEFGVCLDITLDEGMFEASLLLQLYR